MGLGRASGLRANDLPRDALEGARKLRPDAGQGRFAVRADQRRRQALGAGAKEGGEEDAGCQVRARLGGVPAI